MLSVGVARVLLHEMPPETTLIAKRTNELGASLDYPETYPVLESGEMSTPFRIRFSYFQILS